MLTQLSNTAEIKPKSYVHMLLWAVKSLDVQDELDYKFLIKEFPRLFSLIPVNDKEIKSYLCEWADNILYNMKINYHEKSSEIPNLITECLPNRKNMIILTIESLWDMMKQDFLKSFVHYALLVDIQTIDRMNPANAMHVILDIQETLRDAHRNYLAAI